MLDADEELIVGIPDLCSALGARQDVLAYALSFNDVNVPPEAFMGGSHLRLWRNLPGLQYHNRYHEQLRYHGDRPVVYDHLPGVSILHYGNSDAAALRQKTITRDIPNLENIRQTEGLNFWLLDCLARNYYRTDQSAQAQGCYEEAMERLLPHLLDGEPPEPFYWVPTLMHYLAEQSLDQNDFETARLLCQRGLEWCPNHLPLLDLTGRMLLELGFPLGAIAYFNQCLHLAQTNGFYSNEPLQRTLLNVDPLCNLGCAYRAMKDWRAAIAAFEQALAIDPGLAIAQQNLDEIRKIL